MSSNCPNKRREKEIHELLPKVNSIQMPKNERTKYTKMELLNGIAAIIRHEVKQHAESTN